MAEIEAIEREMFDADGALSITSQETAGLIFEVQSVEEAVEEAEGELERLSSILIEGKGGQQRGH
jgi:cob(I)alamin adenosyltransferase